MNSVQNEGGLLCGMLVWVDGLIIIMMGTKRVMMIMVETTLMMSMSMMMAW